MGNRKSIGDLFPLGFLGVPGAAEIQVGFLDGMEFHDVPWDGRSTHCAKKNIHDIPMTVLLKKNASYGVLVGEMSVNNY